MSELLMDSFPAPSAWVFLLTYAGGLAAGFTPCVYPLIPVTLALLGNRGQGSPLAGFFHSVLYVTGIAVTYAALGFVAASTGALFGQWQANPWVYFFLGNFFLALGLAKLGLFSFSLNMEKKWHPSPSPLPGGAFGVGLVSGLAVGPCTAPLLAALLGYVATGESQVAGASLLFVFALGMGTPLVVIGTLAGVLTGLPRGGSWMVWVDRLMGVLLLGAAQYFFIMTGQMML
jgi:thiol:disulfide interchange protein DsbD